MADRTCPYCDGPMPPRHRTNCDKPECKRARKNDITKRWMRNYKKRTGSGYRDRYERNTYRRTCRHCFREWTTGKKNANYCSPTCVAGARKKHLPELHPNPAPVTVLPDKHPVHQPPPPGTWWTHITTGPCHHCGNHFTAPAAGPDKPRFCSTRCLRAHAKTTRRARQHQAYREDVYRTRIHQRDNYRCQICHRKTLPSQTTPHPRAPTIDHIIPLAAGGTHEPSNVQTACFLCNCEKQDGAANDQLRLIG